MLHPHEMALVTLSVSQLNRLRTAIRSSDRWACRAWREDEPLPGVVRSNMRLIGEESDILIARVSESSRVYIAVVISMCARCVLARE